MDKKLRIIDLFAGIGGIRLGFEKIGAECVFSSEWDKHAQDMYEENYGERPFGDINDINPKDILDHDFLLAGFPCQPFSIAGNGVTVKVIEPIAKQIQKAIEQNKFTETIAGRNPLLLRHATSIIT